MFETAPAVQPTDEVPDWTLTEMDIHMISLLRLPEDTNLRCDNVKMTTPKGNAVYFQLDRKFDIFFSVTTVSNVSDITKIEVCYQQALTIEPVQDVMLNMELLV